MSPVSALDELQRATGRRAIHHMHPLNLDIRLVFTLHSSA